MTEPEFKYDKFIQLAEEDLVHYMEPLLVADNTTVSPKELARLISELSSYDEYHLVYALTFCAKHAPEKVSPQVPQYLAHPSGSVCCTALNILDQLPDALLTPEIVTSVRSVISSRRVRKFVGALLGRLEQRNRNRGGQQPD